jgi:phage tail-like protein
LLRLCTALDEVLAPIFLVLDNVDAYFDPDVAPDDFLDLLAGWVGAENVLARNAIARRRLVGEAVQLLRWLGTPHGLKQALALYTGAEVEVVDNGQSLASRDAHAALDDLFDLAPPAVSVKVRGRPTGADARRFTAGIEAITRAWAPAHVVTTVEVTP